MAGTSRVDAHTAETRVDAVRVLLLKGQEDTPRLVQEIANQFGVNTRQAYNYVAKAKKQIVEIGEIDRAYRLAEQIAMRREIRRKAFDTNDLRTALAAAQDEAKLLGLYPADKHEVTGKDGDGMVIRLTWGD
jgi:transposase-like protein